MIALEVECEAARDTSQATMRRIDLLGKKMSYGQASPEDIAAMNAELEQLRKVRGAQNEKYEQLAALLVTVRDFMTGLRPGAILEMAPDPNTMPRDGETVTQAVERLRIEIFNQKRYLRNMATTPLSSSFYKQHARAYVEELAARGRPPLDPRPNHLEIAFPDLGITTVAWPFLAWLHKDAMIAALESEVDALKLPYNETTPASRERLLDEGRSTLLQLERYEEGLVRSGEAVGTTIPRRIDANVLAVLAIQFSPPPRPPARVKSTEKARAA